MIGAIVYLLCAVTSGLCAILLSMQFRRSGVRMLFWSSLCFAGLSLNNLILLLDYFTPHIDLSVPRIIPAVIGIGTMIWAFIWETV